MEAKVRLFINNFWKCSSYFLQCEFRRNLFCSQAYFSAASTCGISAGGGSWSVLLHLAWRIFAISPILQTHLCVTMIVGIITVCTRYWLPFPFHPPSSSPRAKGTVSPVWFWLKVVCKAYQGEKNPIIFTFFIRLPILILINTKHAALGKMYKKCTKLCQDTA